MPLASGEYHVELFASGFSDTSLRSPGLSFLGLAVAPDGRLYASDFGAGELRHLRRLKLLQGVDLFSTPVGGGAPAATADGPSCRQSAESVDVAERPQSLELPRVDALEGRRSVVDRLEKPCPPGRECGLETGA